MRTDLVYFAFVNCTTLGYGDVVPLERWRLLGPVTAMNGILLFGWSTAVIFEVLRRTLARSLEVSRQIESTGQSGTLTLQDKSPPLRGRRLRCVQLGPKWLLPPWS